MAKAAKNKKNDAQAIGKLLNKVLAGAKDEDRLVEIKSAQISDDFCNYSYEIIQGIGLSDTHTVKGSGIIDDDMREAFAVLNVHLAVIDDIFKHAQVEIVDVDKMHSHELATHFHVTGFSIKGDKENESIALIGNKYCHSAGGRMEIKSPKIPMDNLSSYKWYNELKKAADDVRREIELYRNGKYTLPEKDETEEDAKQTKITFSHGTGAEAEDSMDDFDKAKA